MDLHVCPVPGDTCSCGMLRAKAALSLPLCDDTEPTAARVCLEEGEDEEEGCVVCGTLCSVHFVLHLRQRYMLKARERLYESMSPPGGESRPLKTYRG